MRRDQLGIASRQRFRADLAIVGLTVSAALVTRAGAFDQGLRNAVLGVVLGIVTLQLMFDLALGRVFPRVLIKPAIWAGLLTGLYAVSAVYSPSLTDALVTVLQLVLILAWVLYVSLIPWTESLVKAIHALAALFVLASLVLWVVQGFPLDFTGFLYHKHNTGGMLLACLFFFPYAAAAVRVWYLRKAMIPLVLASMVLLWATGSRTSIIAAAIALVVYVLWPTVTRTRVLYLVAFSVPIIGSMGMVFLYMNLDQYPYFASIQESFQRYSRAPLYSGRELIWPVLIDQILQRPLLGWGAGFREEVILYHPVAGGLSTHSLYLALALQVGLIGLGIGYAFLQSIWSVFGVASKDPIVRLSASFFFAICIHQWFELSLIQNNISMAILFWLIIGIGVNRVVRSRRVELRLPSHHSAGSQ